MGKKKPRKKNNKNSDCNDLVNVSSISSPIGQIFYIDIVYGDDNATPDLLADIYKKYLGNSKGKVEETKCYCGHTTECDCGVLTRDEFAEKLRSGDAAFIRKFIDPAIK